MAMLFVMVFFVYADEPVDVIFMINTSYEMIEADAERSAPEAISIFLGTEEMANSRVSVIAYSDNLEDFPFTTLDSEFVIEEMRDKILGLNYYGDKTQFRMAYQAALTVMRPGTQNTLIFIITTHEELPVTPEFTRRGIPVHMIDINEFSNADELSSWFTALLQHHREGGEAPFPEREIPEEPTEYESEPEFESEPQAESESEEIVNFFEAEAEEEPEEEPVEETEGETNTDTDTETESETETEITEGEEPIHTILAILAIFSGIIAPITVFRFVRAMI
ncbi:MAG: VWA domain-containing protein [Defluviitaleaceae bacterium]|nr:VWA domain-containing protein [Defluviitaleaceae bacterium]